MLLHTRGRDRRLRDRRRHAGDRPHQPHGQPPDRLRRAAQQGDRRAQRLRARVRASTRTACSRSARPSRSWTRPPSGWRGNDLVLGKHSGRHALRQALAELGFAVDGAALNTAFKRFKEIADKKKQVTAMDLEALVTDELRGEIAGYTLEWFDVEASSRRPPHAKVSVTTPDGASVAGRLHRRRPDRRDLPRDQLGHGRRRAAARVPRRRGHRRPGRARRGLGRARARRAERQRPGRRHRHPRGRRARLRARAVGRRARRCAWPPPPRTRAPRGRRSRPDAVAGVACAARRGGAAADRPGRGGPARRRASSAGGPSSRRNGSSTTW